MRTFAIKSALAALLLAALTSCGKSLDEGVDPIVEKEKEVTIQLSPAVLGEPSYEVTSCLVLAYDADGAKVFENGSASLAQASVKLKVGKKYSFYALINAGTITQSDKATQTAVKAFVAKAKSGAYGANTDYEVTSGTCVNIRCSIVKPGQEPWEEIIDTKTVQLPIELEEHVCVYPVLNSTTLNNWPYKFDKSDEFTYTTTRKDGKADRDYWDQYDPDKTSGTVHGDNTIGKKFEYVSTRGVKIAVKGGDLVMINTYRSGKTDTTVVTKAAFTTSTEYSFYKFYKYHDVDPEESQAPRCSFADGVWNIEKIGYGWFEYTSHTLTATAGENTTSLTVNQQSNYPVVKKTGPVEFKSHRFYSQRDNWPNFEDYPVGSTPKWPRNGYGEYQPTEDTKDLHPDGNRYIDFHFLQTYDEFEPYFIYLSGAKDPLELNRSNIDEHLFRGGITITATADVKLKDGSTKTVVHRSEWIQPEDGTEKYKDRYYSDMQCFAIYIPVVENAAEDFEWTFKIEFSLTDKHAVCYALSNLKDDTNFFEYDWTFPEYKFKDCLSTVKDFDDAKKISGLFGLSEYREDCQGDIIDGVEQ